MATFLICATAFLLLCVVMYRALGNAEFDPEGRNPDGIYGLFPEGEPAPRIEHEKGHTTTLVLSALAIIILIGWGLTPAEAAEVAPPAASTVTLESSLVSIIESVQTGVQAGVTFLSEEIPDVLRQLILWKIIYHAMWALLQASLIVGAVLAARKAFAMITEQTRLEAIAEVFNATVENTWRSHVDEKLPEWLAQRAQLAEHKAASSKDIPKIIAFCLFTVVTVIAALIAACGVFGNILQMVQLSVAPKVWLIEYAASLVNK